MPFRNISGNWVLKRPVDILRSKYGKCEDVVFGDYVQALKERRANIVYDALLLLGKDHAVALEAMNSVLNNGEEVSTVVSNYL